MNPEAPEAPEFRDYLRLVRRRGWIMLACLILIPLGIYAYTKSKPAVYESRTILQVRPGVEGADLTQPNFTPTDTNLSLVAAIVSTTAVANEAARLLNLPPGSLQGAATAAADPDTGFLTITADSSSAKRAQQVATAFAQALTATRKDQGTTQIDRATATIQEALKKTPKSDVTTRTQLQSQLQRLETLRQAQAQNASVIEPARAGAQISPHPRRNATVGIVIAILIGAGLIALFERMDRRIHKPEDIERLTGIPFLATIPQAAFPGEQEESSDVHEAFQTLRGSLTYFNPDSPLRTILVVSGLKGEGKTTVATNLAIAYATFGKRVILVDTDLRKPDAASRMSVSHETGLSQVLAGTGRLAEALREVKPFGPRLRVLPAGAIPPNPPALLGSARMANLLGELRSDADLVILDTTPLLAVSDAFPLLDKAEGIVALVRLEKTPRDALRRMLQIISSAGGEVLGIVATDGKRRISGGYGYGYGYGDDNKKRKLRRQGREPTSVAAAGDNGSVPSGEAQLGSAPPQ